MTGEASYLRLMRKGTPPHCLVTLGNGDESFDVAVVLLPHDVMMEIHEKVEEHYAPVFVDGKAIANPKNSERNRASYYNGLLCYYSMRLPNDLNKNIASSYEETIELLDDEDINRVCEKYNELIVNKAPKLEALSEEQLDELKKYLEVTPLKDLSTVSLIHLKYCHQTLVSENCLMNSGSGSLSISK